MRLQVGDFSADAGQRHAQTPPGRREAAAVHGLQQDGHGFRGGPFFLPEIGKVNTNLTIYFHEVEGHNFPVVGPFRSFLPEA